MSSTSGWPPQSPMRSCLPQCLHSLRPINNDITFYLGINRASAALKHTNLCTNVVNQDFKTKTWGLDLRIGHYLHLSSVRFYIFLKSFSHHCDCNITL